MNIKNIINRHCNNNNRKKNIKINNSNPRIINKNIKKNIQQKQHPVWFTWMDPDTVDPE